MCLELKRSYFKTILGPMLDVIQFKQWPGVDTHPDVHQDAVLNSPLYLKMQKQREQEEERQRASEPAQSTEERLEELMERAGWKEEWDNTSKQCYYYNEETRETTWDAPTLATLKAIVSPHDEGLAESLPVVDHAVVDIADAPPPPDPRKTRAKRAKSSPSPRGRRHARKPARRQVQETMRVVPCADFSKQNFGKSELLIVAGWMTTVGVEALNISGNKFAEMCPNNHTPTQATSRGHYCCDICGCTIAYGDKMLSCRDCNWDCCVACHDTKEPVHIQALCDAVSKSPVLRTLDVSHCMFSPGTLKKLALTLASAGLGRVDFSGNDLVVDAKAELADLIFDRFKTKQETFGAESLKKMYNAANNVPEDDKDVESSIKEMWDEMFPRTESALGITQEEFKASTFGREIDIRLYQRILNRRDPPRVRDTSVIIALAQALPTSQVIELSLSSCSIGPVSPTPH